MTLFYNYNSVKKEITQKQYDDLMDAVELYNACISGEDFQEPTTSWNINTGVHYGIIADCHYSNNTYGVLFVILDIIVGNSEILRAKIPASGLLSIWRRAYVKYTGTDKYDDGSELVGEVLKFSVTNRPYNNKNFTEVDHLRFVSNDEFNAIVAACDEEYVEAEDDE